MLGVDVLAVWSQGRTEFAVWFAAASLVGNFLFVRRSTRLPFVSSVALDVAMTGASWLFVAAVPISLVAYVLTHSLLFDGRADPVSWIAAVLLSALVGTASGLAVLAVFKQRVTASAFCLLFTVNLICVGIAVYRMMAYINAHPPVA